MTSARGALTRAALALAALRVGLGVAGLLLSAFEFAPGIDRSLPALLMLSFGGVSALLFLGGRGDRRVFPLGGAYLLIAAQFASPSIRSTPSFDAIVWLNSAVDTGYFLPAFLWLFFADFPALAEDPHGRWRDRSDLAVRAALVSATVFLALDVAQALAIKLALLAQPLIYGELPWTVLSLLSLPALPIAWWRSRRAPAPERARVRLFLAALAIGLGPLFAQVLLEGLFPGYGTWTSQPALFPWIRGVLHVLLLSTPFTTGYAVLVAHALDVRLVLRTALRYALARSTLFALASLPFLALFGQLVEHRDLRVAELLASRFTLACVAASAASVVLLASRRGALRALDRLFFRDPVEADKTLALVIDAARRAHDTPELGRVLQQQLDAALHVERFALLAAEHPGEVLRPVVGHAPVLNPRGTLAGLLAGGADPLEVDLERAGSPLRRLPEADRVWLADSGFELLVPLLGSNGELSGVLALGSKRSELPFTRSDCSLLRAIGSSAALALENQAIRRTPYSGGPQPVAGAIGNSQAADECPSCLAVHPAATARCPGCGAGTHPALLPQQVHDKFRLEARLGAGGMGVVYRATDLDLGRTVALKTLPRVSPDAVRRLRREARATAAVSHPHLATIHGLETWAGTPFLVMEFLAGGSLAWRLHATRRIAIGEVLDLGIALTAALEHAHRAGILHRDIKPSNVGYTASGVPKLLDFGLARLLGLPDSGGLKLGDAESPDSARTASLVVDELTESGVVLGTPAYLAPETARGEPVTTGCDLWGIGLLLYEALSGGNPFVRDTLADTLEAIRKPAAPDVRQRRPDCPPELADCLSGLLGPDPTLRESDAGVLRQRLESIRVRCEV